MLSPMMRILYILPTFRRGGATNHLCRLAANLPRDEFDVSVCALGADEKQCGGGILPPHWGWKPQSHETGKLFLVRPFV